MGQRYSETPPSFADGIECVVFVVEGILVKPPEAALASERLAVALCAAGAKPMLNVLSVPDSIDLVAILMRFHPELGESAEPLLDELELEWAISADLTPRVGAKELVLHLMASGVHVAFISALSQKVARLIVAKSLGLTTAPPVFGRRSTSGITTSLIDAHKLATIDRNPSRIVTIAHASFSNYVPSEMTHDLTVVGGGDLDIVDLAVQCALTDGEKPFLEQRAKDRARIRVLTEKGKTGLSNDEFEEYMQLSGGMRPLGNLYSHGYHNIEVGQSNARLLASRRRQAADGQFLLEVISTDAALMEGHLRNWLIVHRSSEFNPERRITFGQTVDLAEKSGFPAYLVERLRTFNKLRNDAIHNITLGIRSYTAMVYDYMEDCSLLLDIEAHFHDSSPIWGNASGFFY